MQKKTEWIDIILLAAIKSRWWSIFAIEVSHQSIKAVYNHLSIRRHHYSFSKAQTNKNSTDLKFNH